MAVYVDDVKLPYGDMIMCHMWADSLMELLAMADSIGLERRWLQRPPHSSWIHFDICRSKKMLALKNGALLTDKYGPVEHLARLRGDNVKLGQIAECRKVTLLPEPKI